jgi:putative copper resistance protein D
MAPAGVAALGAGLVLAWNVLAVPAYPTSFADSPVSFAVQPIAHGARIYGDHCAVCHGARGYGDGPAAALFANMPADLASDRLLRHRDGELFWWVTHGIENTPMPGFSDTLGEMDRWEVVAFLRAQAEAEASISLGPEIGPSPTLAAPDFNFEIDNQPQDNLLSQRSRAAILLVLYTLPGSLPRLRQLEEARVELERRGARIIAAPMGEMGMSGPIAAAPNPDLITAYMLYYRTERIADRSSAPHHIEFLIDRDGYIRARSIPDGASGWGTLSTLLVELDRLSHETPRTQAPTLGAHTH